MVRPLRVWVPEGWYHVANRGNRGARLFRTDYERRRFLGCLSELPGRSGVAVGHGGWRLSEVVGRIAGLKYPAAGQGVKRIQERRTRDAACDRFIRRFQDQMLKLRM